MDAIQKYNVVREFVALISGPYGETIQEEHPTFKTVADEVFETIKHAANDEKNTKYPQTTELVNSLNDLRELRKLVPDNSYETLKELKNEETRIISELQTLLQYEPELFYEIYFLTLGLTQKYANANASSKGVVNSDDFKLWFGASKVVDDKNLPLTLFHGTGGIEDEFTKFDFKMFPGIYFAENKSYSDWFAKLKGTGGMVFECYLRILNPLDLSHFKTEKVTYEDFVAYIELRYGYQLPENPMLRAMSDSTDGMWAWRYLRGGVDWLKYIKGRGEFDGIHFYENNPDDQVNGKENITKAWMVFEPNQIKAVNGNLTYSLQSADIRFEEGGTV